LGTQLRREFFPEVDAGAFEIYVRGSTGTRIEVTEEKIAKVENFVRETIEKDLQLIISELGVTADWSAAYTPNSGPMDAVVKVQLESERQRSAQEYVDLLRAGFAKNPEFSSLEFAFDAGGMIRGAMNEGKSTPINVRIRAKNPTVAHNMRRTFNAQSRTSTASWIVGSCSGLIILNTSSMLIAPRPQTLAWISPTS
jgi:multidrug efflux pump subunit AcrB